MAAGEEDERMRRVRETAGADVSVVSNMYATFLRHPDLQAVYGPFGEQLRRGSLPARDRELVILRTAWNCGSAYEWGAHVDAARTSGITDDEMRRIAEGADAPGWEPFDAALLRAADELHLDACITDETWAVLAARYAPHELIELAALIGNYHLIAFVANSAGTQPEPELAPLPVLPEPDASG